MERTSMVVFVKRVGDEQTKHGHGEAGQSIMLCAGTAHLFKQ